VLPTGQAVVASHCLQSSYPDLSARLCRDHAGMGIFTEFTIPHDNYTYVAPQVACLPNGRIFCTAYNYFYDNPAITNQYRILDPLTAVSARDTNCSPVNNPAFALYVSSPSG
jgi:hypothetical protein